MTTTVYDPGGLGFRIDRLWAFLAIHGDGDESVTAFQRLPGQWMPMVCADLERVESIRPAAQYLVRETGKPIMLARFDNRTDEGLILP